MGRNEAKVSPERKNKAEATFWAGGSLAPGRGGGRGRRGRRLITPGHDPGTEVTPDGRRGD